MKVVILAGGFGTRISEEHKLMVGINSYKKFNGKSEVGV